MFDKHRCGILFVPVRDVWTKPFSMRMNNGLSEVALFIISVVVLNEMMLVLWTLKIARPVHVKVPV